ncbi:MAG: hypothetical protein KKC75_08340 [Nanoarchaeota archaeon]|nr:hypothetical protein [Nanoarchaeota archaeon]MBU1004480.1 hypothetical protein [Nanoarchaeota archaeon]MBU1945650.1 hypothetical protein [Nanoarchaeota archaeon]
MVDKNLAEKCRRWVEEYSGGVNSSVHAPAPTQPVIVTPRQPESAVEMPLLRPVYLTERDYRVMGCKLVKVADVEADMNVKSMVGRFDDSATDEIVDRFGSGTYIQCAYLTFPSLFYSMLGKEKKCYCDADIERNIDALLSRLRENSLSEAGSIGADMALVQPSRISLIVEWTGFLDKLPILIPPFLGVEYSFHYHATAPSEFYRRNK